MKASLNNQPTDYKLELNEMKSILMKQNMSNNDLIRLKEFLYRGIEKPSPKSSKDHLREKLIMLAYLLDL